MYLYEHLLHILLAMNGAEQSELFVCVCFVVHQTSSEITARTPLINLLYRSVGM
jgi:hypothetical protein